MIYKLPPDEYPLTLYVNSKEIGTYQLTKLDLDDWTIGNLFNEGIIESPGDIRKLTVDEGQGKIWVDLHSQFDTDFFQYRKKHFTTGCGNGATFLSMTDIRRFKKVKSNRTVTFSDLPGYMHEFSQKSPLYQKTGGMHGACLIDGEGNLSVREDIGRHNAIDKVIGYALQKNLNPQDLILLTTGRISYEMLAKSAHFGIGLIGSRTAATRQAIQLANHLNVEVVGYIRGKMIQVYTSCGRVINDLNPKAVVE